LLSRGRLYQCANTNIPTPAFTHILVRPVKTLKSDHVWAPSITGAEAYIRKLFKAKDVFERRMSAGVDVVFSPLICLDVTKFVLLGLYSYGDDLLKNVGKTTAQEKSTSGWPRSLKKTSLLKLPIDSTFPCFYLIHSLQKHYTPVNPRSNSRFVYSALSLSLFNVARLQDTVTKIKRWLCDVKIKEQTMKFNRYCRHKWCKKRSPSWTRRFAR